jgi:hypothetical protein
VPLRGKKRWRPVGQVQEVPGATGGVEHPQREQLLLDLAQLGQGGRRLDAGLEGLHQRWPYHLHHVQLAGEVGAVGVSLVLAEALLEEGAEDRRAHLGPVVRHRQQQQLQLAAVQLQRRDLPVEAAVEVGRAGVPSARRYARGGHLPEQPEQQVVGAGALDGVGDRVAEQVARQQVDVLGEHRHHRLQHEPLRR